MKNLLMIFFFLSSSIYGADIFEIKDRNYQYVINSYIKIMGLNNQNLFCSEVVLFEEDLYTIIDQDENLITY